MNDTMPSTSEPVANNDHNTFRHYSDPSILAPVGAPGVAEDGPRQGNHYAKLAQLLPPYFENQGNRLGVSPGTRLFLAVSTIGIHSYCLGFFIGYQLAGLRYLAEHAHLLPRDLGRQGHYHHHHVTPTKQQPNNKWMAPFYSGLGKARLKTGFNNALMRSTRSVLYTSILFGLEANLDYVRQKIDFLSTTAAAGICGMVYSRYYLFDRVQAAKNVKGCLVLGLLWGITQDAARWSYGHEVWYLSAFHDWFKDKPQFE